MQLSYRLFNHKGYKGLEHLLTTKSLCVFLCDLCG